MEATISELPRKLTAVEIEVWVCPNCGNYYGSSAEHGVDLTQIPKRAKVEDEPDKGGPGSDAEKRIIAKRGSRADCGACLERPERVKKTATIKL